MMASDFNDRFWSGSVRLVERLAEGINSMEASWFQIMVVVSFIITFVSLIVLFVVHDRERRQLRKLEQEFRLHKKLETERKNKMASGVKQMYEAL